MFEWAIYRPPKILTFLKWRKTLQLLQRTVFLAVIKIAHNYVFFFKKCVQSSLCGAGKIAPEENCSPVRVRVWFRISVRTRAGGQFSSGAIFLELFMLPSIFEKQNLFELYLVPSNS